MAMFIDEIKNNRQVIRESSTEDFSSFFNDIVDNAKMFYVSKVDDFVEPLVALRRNASALKGLLRLPHNPMVIEAVEHKGRTCSFYKQTGNDQITMIVMQKRTDGKVNVPFVVVFYPNTICRGTMCDDDSWNIEVSFNTAYPTEKGLVNIVDEKHLQKLFNVFYTHWCLLGVINSPTIVDFTPKDYTKMNKLRKKCAQLPLTEYSVIHLKKHVREQMTGATDGEGITKLHWRRGHFKARKTGIYWWNPHTAGRKENGEVISGYLLEDKAS